MIKITGRCEEEQPFASLAMKIASIIFPDGEVRIEAKIVSGHERAIFFLGFRDQGDRLITSRDNYSASVAPRLGSAILSRSNTSLVSRRDLSELLAPDDWNSLAVRARGADLWVFVNDQLVAQASEPTFDSGRIFFGLQRLGDLADTAESAVVIRNLRVSRLSTGDPARAPTLDG